MSPVSGGREVPKGWETGKGDQPRTEAQTPRDWPVSRLPPFPPPPFGSSMVQETESREGQHLARGVQSGAAVGHLPREDALQGCGVPTLASSPPVRGVPRAALGEDGAGVYVPGPVHWGL